jgi:hypothetical protein
MCGLVHAKFLVMLIAIVESNFETTRINFSLFLCKLVKVGKILLFLNCTMWYDYTSWILLYMTFGIGVFFNVSHICCVLHMGKCYNWSNFYLPWWFSWSWICCWLRTPQRLHLFNEGMCNLECWKEKNPLPIWCWQKVGSNMGRFSTKFTYHNHLC